MLIGVLNSNTRSISLIECVMVLVCWLGSVDHIWHTAHDLGTSTCLVQGTQCKKYKIKIADCIGKLQVHSGSNPFKLVLKIVGPSEPLTGPSVQFFPRHKLWAEPRSGSAAFRFKPWF